MGALIACIVDGIVITGGCYLAYRILKRDYKDVLEKKD